MEISNIIHRLDREAEKVISYLSQLDQDSWEAEIYTDGQGWKVHQILAHFVSVERAFRWLTADIATGGKGAPEDFDLDRFNQEQVQSLQSRSRQELMSAFKAEREATITQASTYDEEDLLKEGNHPWFGQASVGSLLKLLYRHNQLHLRDIRRQLKNPSN